MAGPPAPTPSEEQHPTFLPPPDDLRAYDALVPGIAARIFDRWEKQLTHQQWMERRGLNYAFGLALAFLLVSAAIIVIGIVNHDPAGPWAGGVLGTFDIAAVVGAFILVSRRTPT